LICSILGKSLSRSLCLYLIPQPSASQFNLNEIYFTDENVGTTIGEFAWYYDAILRTINGGTTWTPQSSRTTSFLWGVSFTDANNGTAVGLK